MIRLIIVFSLFFGSIGASSEPNRILYLMQTGHVEEALKIYQKHIEPLGHHDLELVQRIGLLLLDQGNRSDDPETQLMTIFGAGISLNERVLYILEDGLKSQLPQLQLISLNFISHFQDDEMDTAFNYAMRSNYLLIRLEALHTLAQRKTTGAVAQIEALMAKVPKEVIPLFSQLYAMVGTSDAMKNMRKLLVHSNEKVRIATVLSAVKYGRDDLLPGIRTLSTHHLSAQQEACAFALGVFKDEKSVNQLELISNSKSSTTRLAALQALYRLGRQDAKTAIESIAKTGDLFAINILKEIPGSEDLLFQLTQSQNIHVKVNAAFALLERKDPRCLPMISAALLKDSRDLAFSKVASPGMALSAFKIIPSAQQNLEEDSVISELSLSIREDVLRNALELPEDQFLRLASLLFESQQNDLIPELVGALEDLQTPSATSLLKKYQQKAGAPLIRNYCNLSLYRLNENGPYAENLYTWVASQHHEELIRFRPFLPWEKHDEASSYQLTPEDTSRLLIESYEALAQSQDDKGINVLLNAILYGHKKNKFALAGLMIRAAQ